LASTRADHILIDYSSAIAEEGDDKSWTRQEYVTTWMSPEKMGNKLFATQHLLGLPKFNSVTNDEIIVISQVNPYPGTCKKTYFV
jgi:hypothetical protein